MLLWETMLLANAIDPQRILVLSGSPEDFASEDYRRLSS